MPLQVLPTNLSCKQGTQVKECHLCIPLHRMLNLQFLLIFCVSVCLRKESEGSSWEGAGSMATPSHPSTAVMSRRQWGGGCPATGWLKQARHGPWSRLPMQAKKAKPWPCSRNPQEKGRKYSQAKLPVAWHTCHYPTVSTWVYMAEKGGIKCDVEVSCLLQPVISRHKSTSKSCCSSLVSGSQAVTAWSVSSLQGLFSMTA